ncbi:MAG TPA: DUF4127 family protein [Armatimonadota bacterium]|nr:DUF4127 family protein [Armatimonadota bacterium]
MRPPGAATAKIPAFALLPLDDRPPNLQFPRRLAAIGGLELRVPPRRQLGRFLRPGDTEALGQWLAAVAGEVQGIIVSCDMLAYGGLVASRTTEVTQQAAAARVRRLCDLRRRFPHLRIHAFAVIPRLGLTVSSPRLAKLGPMLARYDALRHRPALEPAEAEELTRLGAALPPAVVAGHAAMRRRNLAVNKELVGLAERGVVDYLVLAQEDAPPSGPHVAEQAELATEAASRGVAEVVRIFPGADEQGMVLLARAAGRAYGAIVRVQVMCSTPGGTECLALFEDRPVGRTLAGQIEAAGLEIAPTAQAADIVLALHTPPTPTQDDITCVAPGSAPPAEFIGRIAQATAAGRAVALADVAYCNGVDPALIAALAGHRALPRLAAFAGWNTAGNTIGAALAHAALRVMGARATAGSAPRRAHVEFLFERLLDDFGYQTVVRAQAYRFAREELGAYPLHLRRGRRRAAEYVRRRLGDVARGLFAAHFAGVEVDRARIAELRDLRIRLPWPRLFEVEVEARIAVTA